MKPKPEDIIIMDGIRNPLDISAGVESCPVPMAKPHDSVGDVIDFIVSGLEFRTSC